MVPSQPYEDDIQLAIALSLSEASSGNGPQQPTTTTNPFAYPLPPPAQAAAPQRPQPIPSTPPTAIDTSSDAELARALQEQFDREQQQPPPVAQPPTPPHQPPSSLNNNSNSNPYPSIPPPVPAYMQQPFNPLPVDSNTCAGCNKSLTSLTSKFTFGMLSGIGGSSNNGRGQTTTYITALGRNWHPSCFKCTGCGTPFNTNGPSQFVLGGEDNKQPYHHLCHKTAFHPRCGVCKDYLPMQGDNRMVWSQIPFWNDKVCPKHNEDGTKRCTSCTRMQPTGEQWAELEDGRSLCLSCISTIIVDTAACQPLYLDIQHFYASQQMQLPAIPPLLLVASSALNNAEAQETSGRGRGGGPVFHTRGLCLTEYTTIQTVLRQPGGGSSSGGGIFSLNPFAVKTETVKIGAPTTRCDVTAILVLYGLPRLLTGSILAHECMHAYLRLNHFPALSPEVEEGLCQLMALLWLEAQAGRGGGFSDQWEERLAAFFGNQIRTDSSYVYGEGFRAALEVYQRFGLKSVLDCVARTGRLPV